MKKENFNTNLFQFISSSPTPYHATQFMAEEFNNAGFIHLQEQEKWLLERGKSYYIIREDGALAAFTLSDNDPSETGFRMLGAHTDSPALQLKPTPDKSHKSYRQLGVEVYGGPLLHTWFDRDLSLAGRVCCQINKEWLKTVLVDFKRPILTIPSLAIHFNREANSNSSVNAQLHLPPIIGLEKDEKYQGFVSLLKRQVNKEHPSLAVTDILGFDIFCYDAQEPSYIGYNRDFICSSRLDNLLSCFVGMTAMLTSKATTNQILICNNHEEIGSTTTSGALGTFLSSILERILPDTETNRVCLNKSFLISMDNAHSVHPNFSDTFDPEHDVKLNYGPVIKNNAKQRYATNSSSRAIYRMFAKEVDVPTQDFVMRSDLACGSTIGPLTATKLGVQTIDIGVPSLGMHSIRETTGSDDPYLLYRTIVQFLNRDTLPHQTAQDTPAI